MKFPKTTLIEIIDERIKKAEEELAKAEAKHEQSIIDAMKAHKDFRDSLRATTLMSQFIAWMDAKAYRNSYVYLTPGSSPNTSTPEYMKQAHELPTVPGPFNPCTHNDYIAALKQDKKMLELSEGSSVTINSVNSKFGVYVS